MSPHRALLVAVALTGVLTAVSASGCASVDQAANVSATASPEPSPLQAGDACPDDAAAGKQVHFEGKMGDDLRGVELGSGEVGIVLAHEDDGSVCEWLPFGKELADKGYRVLTFDFVGNSNGVSRGPDTNQVNQVVAAAAFLRQEGATSIVLLGASMGATAVLDSTLSMAPAPTAIVALSPPARFDGLDAIDGARSIRVPLLVVVAERDQIRFPDIPDTAQAVYNAAPTRNKKLIVVDGLEHGHNLVTKGFGPEATRQQVFSWLSTNAHAR
ncbi:alpha/beta hydrolase [Hamadaea tsunoensis]|uniref:alpha/beta hydrolase n=1 Tax=Hamadaea tsunoensis TaxID=53368 RepID=UPI00040EA767|nr:alpha/beta fold hydrolase [Hamadaea tsunoensis]